MLRRSEPPNRHSSKRPKAHAKSSVWLVFAMILALLSGAPLAALDAEYHAHTVCAEHGEFVHSGHAPSANPTEQAAVSSASGDDGHHEHCSVFAITRRISLGPVAAYFSRPEPPAAAEPFTSSNETAHRPIAIVHYAPSQSPPARA